MRSVRSQQQLPQESLDLDLYDNEFEVSWITDISDTEYNDDFQPFCISDFLKFIGKQPDIENNLCNGKHIS